MNGHGKRTRKVYLTASVSAPRGHSPSALEREVPKAVSLLKFEVTALPCEHLFRGPSSVFEVAGDLPP